MSDFIELMIIINMALWGATISTGINNLIKLHERQNELTKYLYNSAYGRVKTP